MDLKTYLSSSERGTAKALADALGISASYLSQLASGESPISPERAVAIWRATNGLVTRREMLPDTWHLIWPELVGLKKEPNPRLRPSPSAPEEGVRGANEAGGAVLMG